MLVRSMSILLSIHKLGRSPDELHDLVEGCDLLIVPTTPDPLSLEGMMLTLSILKSFNAHNYRVLLTIVPPEPIPEGKLARQKTRGSWHPPFWSRHSQINGFSTRGC